MWEEGKLQEPHWLSTHEALGSKARTIYDIGYKTGLEMVDSIKRRVSARVSVAEVNARRERFASRTPALGFDSVVVTGANEGQAHYLEHLFEGNGRKPIGIGKVEDSYYRAVTDGTLRNLLPQLESGRDGRNTLLLEATLQRPWSVGVGGHHDGGVDNLDGKQYALCRPGLSFTQLQLS